MPQHNTSRSSRSKSPPNISSINRHSSNRDNDHHSSRDNDDYYKKHKKSSSSKHHHRSSGDYHRSSKHSHHHHRSGDNKSNSSYSDDQDRYHHKRSNSGRHHHSGRDRDRDHHHYRSSHHHSNKHLKDNSDSQQPTVAPHTIDSNETKQQQVTSQFSLRPPPAPVTQSRNFDALEQLTRQQSSSSGVGDHQTQQTQQYQNKQQDPMQSQTNDSNTTGAKKPSRFSRFSYAPQQQAEDNSTKTSIQQQAINPETNNIQAQQQVQQQVLQPENEWDKITADKEYLYLPWAEPVRRKKKNKWTDADESEIKQAFFKDKNTEIDTSQVNSALMIGGTQQSNSGTNNNGGSNNNTQSDLLQNLNPAILNALQDSSKIKKKVYIPINTGVNYIGLLIGPRGLYQKRLEEESGCKILIRGKGSQKQGSAPQPDDEDEQHVLIIGDNPEQVRRAQTAIERVIGADDGTREKIRNEQLIVAQQLNNSQVQAQPMDESMMTPYGAPSPYAYIIPVPNDSVGLIIGKNGETIRRLQMDSGAKIQVAKMEIQDTNVRNVFVEGSHEKYLVAKEAIEQIIQDHRRQTSPQIRIGDTNPFPAPLVSMQVLDRFVGLIIGKSGETLKGVAMRTTTKIFVPQKNPDAGSETRTVEISGDTLENCQEAEQEINQLIRMYQQNNNQNSGSNHHGNMQHHQSMGNNQNLHGKHNSQGQTHHNNSNNYYGNNQQQDDPQSGNHRHQGNNNYYNNKHQQYYNNSGSENPNSNPAMNRSNSDAKSNSGENSAAISNQQYHQNYDQQYAMSYQQQAASLYQNANPTNTGDYQQYYQQHHHHRGNNAGNNNHHSLANNPSIEYASMYYDYYNQQQQHQDVSNQQQQQDQQLTGQQQHHQNYDYYQQQAHQSYYQHGQNQQQNQLPDSNNANVEDNNGNTQNN